MKHFLILLMLFSWMSLFSQVRNFSEIPTVLLNQLDQMGVDDYQLLNSSEGAYFNFYFKDSLNGFDFVGKKVGFLDHGIKRDKVGYFKLEKDRYSHNSSPNKADLYIFNEIQKQESGGYDAAIVYWSKVYIPTDDVINSLKKKK